MKRTVLVANKRHKLSGVTPTTIKLKLKTLLVVHSTNESFDKSFKHHIQHVVDNLTLVQQLASDLLNYHLLRLLREDIPLPELDQTFFGRVCTIVTDTNRDNKDGELSNSFQHLRALNPDMVLLVNENMNDFLSSLPRQTMTNFKNHVVMNTRSHVIRYVRFRYALVNNFLAELFVKQCFTNGVVLTEDQQDFKQFCEFYPFDEQQVGGRFDYFLNLSFRILEFLEIIPQETQGRKLFTIAPVKGDWVASCVTINQTTLLNIFAMMTMEHRQFLLETMYLTNQNDPDLDNFMDEHVKTPKYTITKAMLSNKSFTTCCFKNCLTLGNWNERMLNLISQLKRTDTGLVY